VNQGDKAGSASDRGDEAQQKLAHGYRSHTCRIGAPAVEPLKKILTDNDEDLVLTVKATLRELNAKTRTAL